MSNQMRLTNSQSFYLVEGQKQIKLLQGNIIVILENPKLGQLILRISEKESMFSSHSQQSVISEVEVNIDAFSFLEKVRGEGYPPLRAVPAYFMRSICIRNINELVPLVDVYFVLKNLSQDLKRVILVENPRSPGLNAKCCVVEFSTHLSAKKTLNSLNSLHSTPLSKILASEKGSVQALWCEPLVDNIKEMLKYTPFYYFENLFVNNFDIFEFKKFLENLLIKHSTTILIKKIRQFANKVLVQFSENVPLSLFESPIIFKEKIIPCLAAMKPCLNVGKYREKVTRASAHFLHEDDKKILLSKISDTFNYTNDPLKKKAEAVLNRLIAEEKKERPKEKKEEFSHHKRDRAKEEDFKRERSKEKRPSKKEKERSEEKSQTRSNSQIINTNPNLSPNQSNYLAQLTGLLLNNPNSTNVISGLQNLSMLGNLQNILSNPGMLNVLQQLIANPNRENVGINSSNTNFSSSQNQQIQTQTKQSSNLPSQNQGSQINPVYNLPKTNAIENQNPMYFSQGQFQNSKQFYPNQSNSQGQFSFPMQGMPNEMFLNNLQFGQMGNMPNMANMNVQGLHGLQEYVMQQGQNEMENDNNLVMKKYYEYYQNINK